MEEQQKGRSSKKTKKKKKGAVDGLIPYSAKASLLASLPRVGIAGVTVSAISSSTTVHRLEGRLSASVSDGTVQVLSSSYTRSLRGGGSTQVVPTE